MLLFFYTWDIQIRTRTENPTNEPIIESDLVASAGRLTMYDQSKPRMQYQPGGVANTAGYR